MIKVFLLLVIAAAARPMESAISSFLTEKHIIIIDAGSSGSRLHVFNFINDKLENEVFEKTKPGLSSYSSPITSAQSLIPLLDLAKSSIPKEFHASTLISLKATAGLRLLSNEIATHILSNVTEIISLYPFKIDSVSIMDGKNEALLAWLTVNYLTNKLETNETAAALDLGGASTQIVFKPKHTLIKTNLEFQDVVYELFQYSYLGYGLNEARSRILGLGTCNSFEECSKLVEPIFDKSKCQFENCSFNGVYQPDLNEFDGDVFAMDNFYEKTIGDGYDASTVDDVKNVAKEICNSESIKKCIHIVYIYKLLSYGYGLRGDRVIKIQNQFGKFTANWCLGAALLIKEKVL